MSTHVRVYTRRFVPTCIRNVCTNTQDGFSIPPSGKPHLAGDTHAKQEDGVLYHVYERVNTYTHVCPRKHEGESSREKRFVVGRGRRRGGWGGVVAHVIHECAEEERLHTRECVLQKDWRCAGEGRAGSSAWTSCVYRIHTYVYILLLLLCVPRMQTRGVLEVGAPTRERERAA